MGVKPNLMEVLTTVSGLDFDHAFDAHHVTELDGRAALLISKRASGRPKDLADVAWLEAEA